MQVLIVDDDIATVDVIQSTVDWGKLGIEKVLTSYNIENAKKILINEAIDIIISDIEMPQGSGIHLLSWFREKGMEGEFILLTCHESFDYASTAIKLHAAEYILKPFDVAVMEKALTKIILELQENRQLRENSEYGKWTKKNQRQLQLAFWNQIFSGYFAGDKEAVLEEMKKRNLTFPDEKDSYIIVSKITGIEKDKEKINQSLIFFILENIHSEILCGNPENYSVTCFDLKEYYVVVTVCCSATDRGKGVGGIEETCRELLQAFKRIFTADMTCCISKPCKIWEYYDKYQSNLSLIEKNVISFGSYFQEEDELWNEDQPRQFLSLDKMEQFLQNKQVMEFKSYMKDHLNDIIREKTINEQMLKQMKQEILQAVYIYLGKRDISATGLFLDDTLENFSSKATQSVLDMIRWINYLLEKTYAFEEEISKQYNLCSKIKQYIREHYKEDIGRNEIAQYFYLAPEYVSKVFKKNTGEGIKDVIARYRIEEAKILLERGERVSEVAQKVGFDNFTYFSTMFKKYTGITPNQFRKKE